MPIKKGRVPVKIYTDDLDAAAYEQLRKICELPIIHRLEACEKNRPELRKMAAQGC